MKISIKKTIATALILLIGILLFGGCINNSKFHTHNYKLKSNETEHFMECSCGEVKDSTEHAFEWVVDSEPTYTAPGYKHKECTICKYETENTIIERLIHTDGFDNGLTISLPNKKTFANKEKLIEFYKQNKSKINHSYLCMDASSKPEKGIYTTLSLFDNYRFHYDEETENEYTNPYILVSYGIYSNELGPFYDEEVDGAESVSFLMYFYGIDSDIDGYQIEFYENHDPKRALNYVIQIMSGDTCIGTVFYGAEVYISREWMADYLLSNLFVIN